MLEAFFVDGALRDVRVEGTRAQLAEFAGRLREDGWTLSIAEEPVSPDELRSWQPPEGASASVAACRNGCQLNIWVWSPADPGGFFSELDVDPKEVDGDTVASVGRALEMLASVLKRPVKLTIEGMPTAVLAMTNPDGRVVVDVDACRGWRVALGIPVD